MEFWGFRGLRFGFSGFKGPVRMGLGVRDGRFQGFEASGIEDEGSWSPDL